MTLRAATYPSLEFKSQREREEWEQIDSRLQFILEDMSRFVAKAGLKFVVTDLLSDAFEDQKLGRVSTSHTEGRAADVSIKGWDEKFQRQFESFFENAYKSQAAISKKTQLPDLVVIHNNGNGPHAHIQVRRK